MCCRPPSGAAGKWSTFIIWAKNTFTLGRADYQRQYEPILYGWPEGAQRHWCGDRDQGDVWAIKKPQKNDLHPTMKPVELVERAIRNSSRRAMWCSRPVGGSGTTLIAAEKCGRVARLIELDPKYVDVIVRRWEVEHRPDGHPRGSRPGGVRQLNVAGQAAWDFFLGDAPQDLHHRRDRAATMHITRTACSMETSGRRLAISQRSACSRSVAGVFIRQPSLR